jgi:hypothetical protein
MQRGPATTSLRAYLQRESVKELLELSLGDRDGLGPRVHLWKPKATPIQALVKDTQPRTVPEQDLERVAPLAPSSTESTRRAPDFARAVP